MRVWKKKWHSILFFVVFGITIVLLYLAGKSGEKYNFLRYAQMEFQGTWKYTYDDGTTGTTELPAKLEADSSVRTLTLENTLPEVRGNTTLIYRSRHMLTKIYLDDILVYDQSIYAGKESTWFGMEGNVFIEVPLREYDSGKKVTIVSTADISNYLTNPGLVYLGERSSFFIGLVRERIGTLIGAVLLFIFSIILFVAWGALSFTTKKGYQDILCLAFFTLLVSSWQFTETRCLQFVFDNMQIFTVMGYEYLMMIPIPIALYFYYTPWKITKKLSKISAAISLTLWTVNNLLHFLHIAHLAQTLIVTQVVLFGQIIFIGLIQFVDLRLSKKSQDENGDNLFWKLPMIGVSVMVPLLVVEVSGYIAGSQKLDTAILTTIAIFVYILTLALQSAFKLTSQFIQAKSASETKTQFLANMSHEIRTPLNAIMGFDEIILRDARDQKVLDYAQNIRTAGNNLQYIINSILDMSKIESGKMELEEVGYGTAQFLDSVALVVGEQARQKGLEFEMDIDEQLPAFLIGDDMRLRQVLINLLNNAVKYTKEGKVICQAKVLSFSREENKCQIYFSVQDTGVGIKEEDREKLFAKFERLDAEKNRNVEGTGLGMSIVVNLLSAMGSKVELDSVYGKGSDFHFVITQRTIGKTKIGHYEVGAGQHLEGHQESGQRFIAPDVRVLLVDDVALNNIVTKGLLEVTRMQVDAAESGPEAIEMVKKNRYDLILMDHMMPGMDGIQVTNAIRNMGSTTGDSYYTTVPILALTANAITGMREMFMDNGMQDYITKPVDGARLISTMRKWLPQDKLIFGAPEETPENPAISQEKEEYWQVEIPGISEEEAHKFFQGPEEYRVGLQSYVDAYSKNDRNLSEYTQARNFEEAVVIVHGLKSSSKLIGAVELSETAKNLEAKMNARDNGVWTEVDAFLEDYRQLVEAISMALIGKNQKNSSQEQISLKDILAELKEDAENFDMDGLMHWEEKYRDMEVPEAYEPYWNAILDGVSGISFMEIVEKIDEFPEINP